MTEDAGAGSEDRPGSGGEHPTARWHAAIAYALLGEELDLPEPALPRPTSLVAELASAGWTARRVRSHAVDQVGAERVWPHPIPVGLRESCGAAQLSAALGETRRLLGLQALDTRPPSSRTALNADELRLLRDVPPHHGS